MSMRQIAATEPQTLDQDPTREVDLAAMHNPAVAHPNLSVVIPAYNEVASIGTLLPELHQALAIVGESYEIVLVDDGSTDGSDAAIAEEVRKDPRVRGILLERNVGQSGALAAGFRSARGRFFITLDADGQNDPADIPRLLEALNGADVATGVRTRRADSWMKKISSKVANRVRRAVLGDTLTDIGCSMKAYRREAVEGLPLFVGAHRYLPALCQFRGARVLEIPVHHRPRRFGVSKYGVGNRLFRGIYDLIGVRWLKARMIRYRIREDADRR